MNEGSGSSKKQVLPLELILNALPAYVAYLGPTHHYEFVNETYAQSFARTRSQIVGLHLRDLVGDRAYERLQPQLKKAFAGERVPVSVDFALPNGDHRYFQGFYTPDFQSF